MEWFGLISFILVMCYSAYPARVKKLETRCKKLEREKKLKNGEEIRKMTELIKELTGKKCTFYFKDTLTNFFSTHLEGEVLSVDEEWIKVRYEEDASKKSEPKTVVKIIRIEDVESVEYDG